MKIYINFINKFHKFVSLFVQFFYSAENLFCSHDIQVFEFLAIPWFSKSVTSWVLVHETGCIFE